MIKYTDDKWIKLARYRITLQKSINLICKNNNELKNMMEDKMPFTPTRVNEIFRNNKNWKVK